MKRKAENAVDPMQPQYVDRTLWFVYGYDCFPSILCAKLILISGLNIWGYSVYKRQGGFRTLGVPAGPWIGANAAVAFDDQQHALDYLKKLTTPKELV